MAHRFHRPVSHHTVTQVLGAGPTPTVTTRRFPRYRDIALAQYRVAFEPDERHIREVAEVQLFETRYPSPQPYLDGLAVPEWQAALRVPRPARRPRRTTADSGQLPLFDDAQVAMR